MFQEGVRPSLLKKRKKKRERDKKRRQKEREKRRKERKEEGKSEGEPWLNTLKQLMHTNNEEPCSSFFPSLCCSTQINQASPRSIVPTHEARVSHAIIVTIPRNPSFMLAVSILR